eukprot:CAMPEP_0185034740 /NCGR_PEP_ID=MMETSP1103-20130426/24866_1 /TAXON_ID=36769 /ORGANISM="Paraphysomonas bandaiensis, Strain Caron Lab Isolate" /LENGTH=274 /DNA_ID=CAMNT_0027571517 /DNA_START=258 /DNA_END=1079 /DNA_ORIENTATION=+
MSYFGKKLPTQMLNIIDVDGIERGIHYFEAPEQKNCGYPPLIILCGTAQSIQTWAQHVKQFSRERRVIIPELRCQGSTELLSHYGNLQQQISDIRAFLLRKNIYKVDIAGFSFGGRVGIGLAAEYPSMVNKLSVTGVPLVRPVLGKLILQSWKDGLESRNLKATAWSCIINGCSGAFLAKYERSIPALVNAVIESNDMSRMRDLIAHATNLNDECTTHVHAPRVQCPTQIIAASEDRLAGQQSEKALADVIRGSRYDEILQCGHMSPFERPIEW